MEHKMIVVTVAKYVTLCDKCAWFLMVSAKYNITVK